MTTQYITKFVNEYGQVNAYEAIEAIREAIRFKTYATAGKMIEELEALHNGETFEDVNADLFFLTFDECADLSRYGKQIEARLKARQEAQKKEEENAPKIAEQTEILEAHGIQVIGVKLRMGYVEVRRADLEKATAYAIAGVSIVSPV